MKSISRAAMSCGVMLVGVMMFTIHESLVAAQAPSVHEAFLLSKPIDNPPGSQLTAVLVEYAPGAKSPSHHHAGSVFAYVIAGEIRSQNSATGPVRV